MASSDVHSQEFGETGVSAGTFTDTGRKSVVLDATLTPGARYTVRLTLTCLAETGPIGAVTACSYSVGNVTGQTFNGYVRWSRLDVLRN